MSDAHGGVATNYERDQEEGLASVAIKITDYAPAYGTTGTEAGRTD